MALFNKMDSRREQSLQVLLENLQVLLESDILLLLGKYVLYGQIQLNGIKEGSKVYKFCFKTYNFSL